VIAAHRRDREDEEAPPVHAHIVPRSVLVHTGSSAARSCPRSTGSVGLYDQPLFKGGTSSGNPGYCLFLGSSAWTGKIHDGSSFHTPELAPSPQLNQWVHVVMVIDRGTPATVRAFMNGVETDSTALTLGSLSSGSPLTIGAGSGGSRFQGSIDEVRIYDRVLSAPWIATEHANLTSASFLTVGAQQQL